MIAAAVLLALTLAGLGLVALMGNVNHLERD